MRACGCSDRGRHQRECTLHVNKKVDLVFGEEAYVTPTIPHIEWSSTKTRQATVENRIKTLVKRRKSFYLTIDTKYDWYIVGGTYAAWTKRASRIYGYQTATQKKSSGIGAIGNLLPFLSGYRGELGIAFESWLSPSYALDSHATHCSGAVCDWEHGVKLGEPDLTKKRRRRSKKVGV